MTRALALLLLAACTGGPDMHDCVDVERVDEVVDAAIERWSNLPAIVKRLDVICVEREVIDALAYCAARRGEHVGACAVSLGSDVVRARVYVRRDLDVAAALAHELQHLALWRGADGGCPEHVDACGWNQRATDDLARVSVER